MSYLGLIVILIGILLAYMGWQSHNSAVMLTGANFVLIGAVLSPWPIWFGRPTV